MLPSYWDLCPIDSTATCDASIGTVPQLSTCVAGETAEVSTTLVCEQFPDATADGVACPQTCMAASPLDTCDGTDDDCDAGSTDGSEDPTLGSPCDGADADQCLEGTLVCSSGALECSDATGDTIEVCNGLDDDCDGASDEDYPNDTDPLCGVPEDVGEISGDTGAANVIRTEMNERWSSERNDSFADETFDLLIEVRYFSGQSCSEWQLGIQGNTVATTETCP